MLETFIKYAWDFKKTDRLIRYIENIYPDANIKKKEDLQKYVDLLIRDYLGDINYKSFLVQSIKSVKDIPSSTLAKNTIENLIIYYYLLKDKIEKNLSQILPELEPEKKRIIHNFTIEIAEIAKSIKDIKSFQEELNKYPNVKKNIEPLNRKVYKSNHQKTSKSRFLILLAIAVIIMPILIIIIKKFLEK